MGRLPRIGNTSFSMSLRGSVRVRGRKVRAWRSMNCSALMPLHFRDLVEASSAQH
jgi:hypothetical protein